MDVYCRGMDLKYSGLTIHYKYEDTKLTFRDVSYDEEAAQPMRDNKKWHRNLLMKNTSNYVNHPSI
jgi:hypothetical protein